MITEKEYCGGTPNYHPNSVQRGRDANDFYETSKYLDSQQRQSEQMIGDVADKLIIPVSVAQRIRGGTWFPSRSILERKAWRPLYDFLSLACTERLMRRNFKGTRKEPKTVVLCGKVTSFRRMLNKRCIAMTTTTLITPLTSTTLHPSQSILILP